MGEVVELFPNDDSDSSPEEVIAFFEKMIDWHSADPLNKSEMLFYLAEELVGRGYYEHALYSLMASLDTSAELEDIDFKEAISLIIKSHGRELCTKLYGPDESSWSTHVREFVG